MVARYSRHVVPPITRQTVTTVAPFVAGPVISRANAAPGETPATIRPAATGIEAVAQMYTGIPAIIMTAICRGPGGTISEKKFSGTSAEINAATTRPISKAGPISRGRVMKPYLAIRRKGFRRCPWLQHSCSQRLVSPPRDESPPATIETTEPPRMPLKNATSGRKTANTGPSRLNVAAMLSAPVWGVETRNAVVAPLPAPCVRSEAATGITLHEHNGSGTPNADAFNTGRKPLPPRCFSIFSAETSTESTPATRNPSRR